MIAVPGRVPGLALGLLALGLLACGEESSVRAITRSRELAPHAGLAGAGHGAVAGGVHGGAAASPGAPSPLDFALPDGWTALPPSGMRVLDLRVAGDARAECYLVALPGTAGGLAANVNRWRQQMGLAPLSSAELDALPERPFLGAPATAVDMTGRFTGMDGVPRAGEQRLLGLLHISPAGSLFLKAVGPAELLAGEVDAFFALAAGLRPADPHAGHDHAPGADG